MAFRRCLAVGLVGLVLTSPAGGPVRAQDPLETRAQTFVASLADKAVQALTKEGTARAERVRRFRRLFKDHFAVQGMAKWILGRYWRRASDGERAEYLILFEDMIVVSYVDRFAGYTGEALAITKAVALDDGNAMVFSEIVRPTGGPPVRVEWRVATEDESLRIVDVVEKTGDVRRGDLHEHDAALRLWLHNPPRGRQGRRPHQGPARQDEEPTPRLG